jgi:hypothetical protein
MRTHQQDYVQCDFIACLFCFLEEVFEVGNSDYQQAEVSEVCSDCPISLQMKINFHRDLLKAGMTVAVLRTTLK